MSDTADIKRALVIGGTGLLGRPVVERLTADGFEVAVGTRAAGKVSRLFGDSIIPVEIDLTSDNSIRTALEGFDAVHLNLPSGPRFEDCFRNETETVRRVANSAEQLGLKRISYLSGTASDPDEKFPPAQAKWQAEAAIQKCSTPYTIWRATWFMETLPQLVRPGIIAVPGRGRESVHWVAADDFARLLSASFRNKETENKTLYVFGPELVSFRRAARILRDIAYPKRPIIFTPLSLLIMLGSLLPDREMWFGMQMIRFLNRVGEAGDPSETNRLLGAPTQTIANFVRSLSA